MLPIIPPPKGFRIFYSSNSELLLVYRPNGMRYLLIFAIICIFAWILFCIFIATLLITSFILIQDYLISILTFIFFFIPLVMYFFAAKIFDQVYIVLYFFLAQASFDLRFDCLVFNEKLGTFKEKKQKIKRSKIKYIEQVKTSGFKGNRFSSWGLLIKTTHQDYHLLAYQSYDNIQWLGNIIAKWAKVSYLPSLQK
ncbi:hypothetical protein ACP6PL_21390 [Dapis sp. BLCC M126]|uniref:hypothetical protein n=1 Tax=Dapis sp. BLCC M126 TaxID=3400189 RepID=UPI003CF1EACD